MPVYKTECVSLRACVCVCVCERTRVCVTSNVWIHVFHFQFDQKITPETRPVWLPAKRRTN